MDSRTVERMYRKDGVYGSPSRKELGERLRVLREAAGWPTKTRFAEELGINPRTYTSYEQGLAVMPLSIMWDVATKLEITIDALVGFNLERDDTAKRLRVRHIEEQPPAETVLKAIGKDACYEDVLGAIEVMARLALEKCPGDCD